MGIALIIIQVVKEDMVFDDSRCNTIKKNSKVPVGSKGVVVESDEQDVCIRWYYVGGHIKRGTNSSAHLITCFPALNIMLCSKVVTEEDAKTAKRIKGDFSFLPFCRRRLATMERLRELIEKN